MIYTKGKPATFVTGFPLVRRSKEENTCLACCGVFNDKDSSALSLKTVLRTVFTFALR